MPELPEVEVVKQGLEPLLKERIVQTCTFSGKPLRLPLSHNHLKTLILGQKITRVRRRAKYIIIDLSNQASLIIHLGMTGKLGLFKPKSPKQPHDHACFCLDNGMELRFNDVRRFGSLQVVAPQDTLEEFFVNIGPEPFGEKFTVDYLVSKANNKNQPIKNFIMDSRIVAGIGNIYASEILFESGIMPDKPAGKINKTQWKKIIAKTKSVLKRAIAAGGSTIADFVGSSGEKGYFQLQLNVYGRKGLPCPLCNETIIKTVMAGRATFFCNSCQK